VTEFEETVVVTRRDVEAARANPRGELVLL
jgi:hypothetical protein